MEQVKGATIEGFNAFLEEQKKGTGECLVSLYQFDDQYDVVYEGKNIKDAPRLTTETFVPRGWTALLDAIGRTVIVTGSRLAKMPEQDRPGKILIVIQTDGHENKSKEFNYAQIKQMIQHQEQAYSWTFVFLSASLDAPQVARAMGISDSNTSSYTGDSAGTKQVMGDLSRGVSRYRAQAVSQQGSVRGFTNLMDPSKSDPKKKN
jgi:hypothetical protein